MPDSLPPSRCFFGECGGAQWGIAAARRRCGLFPPLCSTLDDLVLYRGSGRLNAVWGVDGGGKWSRVEHHGLRWLTEARPGEVRTGCSSVLTRPDWMRRVAFSCRRSTVTSSRGES